MSVLSIDYSQEAYLSPIPLAALIARLGPMIIHQRIPRPMKIRIRR